MLSFDPKEIKSRDVVSSEVENDDNERIDADLKELFSAANVASGKYDYLVDATNMLDKSVFQYQNDLLAEDYDIFEYKLQVDDTIKGYANLSIRLDGRYGRIMFPEVKQEWKCSRDVDTGFWTLHKIKEDKQFIDLISSTGKKQVKNGVVVERVTPNTDAWIQEGMSIVETDSGVESMLIGEAVPYIMKAIGHSAPTYPSGSTTAIIDYPEDEKLVDVHITIKKFLEGFKGNTLKVVPFPAIKSTAIHTIRFRDRLDNEVEVKWFDGKTLLSQAMPSNIGFEMYRRYTTPQLITFEPATFTSLEMEFWSNLEIYEGNVALGVNLIDVSDVLYSHKSYVGYELDVTNCDRIVDVQFYTTPIRGNATIKEKETSLEDLDYDNILDEDTFNYMFFDDEEEFLNGDTSTDYLIRNEKSFNVANKDTLYLLVELMRTNNTSPVLSSIRVHGEPIDSTKNCFGRF